MASLAASIAQDDVVEAGAVGVFGDAEAGGGVALGVGVDDQDAEVIGGQGGGQIDGGGGFSDAALLVGDGKDSAQAAILARMAVSRGTRRESVSRETLGRLPFHVKHRPIRGSVASPTAEESGACHS